MLTSTAPVDRPAFNHPFDILRCGVLLMGSGAGGGMITPWGQSQLVLAWQFTQI